MKFSIKNTQKHLLLLFIIFSYSAFGQFYKFENDSSGLKFSKMYGIKVKLIKTEYLKYQYFETTNTITDEVIFTENNFIKISEKNKKNIWAFKLKLEKARKINLLFKNLELSEDAELYFLNDKLTEFAGPIKKEMVISSKLLNSGFFNSDNLNIIILENNSTQNIKTRFQISDISYNYKDTNKNFRSSATPPDVSCYFPEYEDLSNAVVKIDFKDVGACTGTLLNNQYNDRTPFVLSARHCMIAGQKAVDSWVPITSSHIQKLSEASISIAYRATSCGTYLPPTKNYITTGLIYIDAGWPSDYLFMKMVDSNLPPTVNYWAWNCNQSTPFGSTGVHNYNGDPQKISFGSSTNSALSLHRYLTTWSIGQTTGGSSGSGLFNGNKQLVGYLSWGTENLKDRYGKFSSAWSNIVQSFLSPSNTQSIGALIPMTIFSNQSHICFGQNAILNMPFLKASENVTWSVSSGLTIVSTSQANKSVTVTPVGSGGSGIGVVTATYFTPNFPSVSKSYSIRYGAPLYSEIILKNLTNSTTANPGGTISISPSSQNSLQISHPVSPVTGANWVFPNGWAVGSNGSVNNTVYNTNGNNGGTISIFPSNQCGISIYPAVFPVIASYSAYRVSPNPAQNILAIEFDDVADIETLPDQIDLISDRTLKKEKGIKIKDIFDKSDFKETKRIALDVSGLERGLYYLEITNLKRKDKPKDSIKIILN